MKPFDDLSARQRKILRYIEQYSATHSYPPTIREIGIETGTNSTSVVNYNLNRLVEDGWLEREQRVSRGVRLTRPLPAKTGSGGPNSTVNTRKADVSMIPLIGKIAAGEPLPVPWDIGHHINEDQMIEVPPFMLGNVDPNEVFALQVQGDSMIDSMIQDGDIVLFRRIYAIPNNGDMVAVWIEKRGETTLKHFYHEGHRIRLQPSHPTMAPIYVEPADCQVHGKVIAVMRRM